MSPPDWTALLNPEPLADLIPEGTGPGSIVHAVVASYVRALSAGCAELDAAWVSGNAPRCRQVAHRLRGASEQVGADALVARLRGVEHPGSDLAHTVPAALKDARILHAALARGLGIEDRWPLP